MTLMANIKTAQVGEQVESVSEYGGSFTTMVQSYDDYELFILLDRVEQKDVCGVYDFMSVIDTSLLSKKHGWTFVNNKEIYVLGRIDDSVYLVGYQYDGVLFGLAIMHKKGDFIDSLHKKWVDVVSVNSVPVKSDKCLLNADTGADYRGNWLELIPTKDEAYELATIHNTAKIYVSRNQYNRISMSVVRVCDLGAIPLIKQFVLLADYQRLRNKLDHNPDFIIDKSTAFAIANSLNSELLDESRNIETLLKVENETDMATYTRIVSVLTVSYSLLKEDGLGIKQTIESLNAKFSMEWAVKPPHYRKNGGHGFSYNENTPSYVADLRKWSANLGI